MQKRPRHPRGIPRHQTRRVVKKRRPLRSRGRGARSDFIRGPYHDIRDSYYYLMRVHMLVINMAQIGLPSNGVFLIILI